MPSIRPITDIDDPRYAKALAHPLRIRILAMLAEERASPVQLSTRLDATLGTVAYHVRTLHALGLLELVDTRQRRGATEHVYRAREHPRITDDAWAGLAPIAKQRLLGAMLHQFGGHVTSAAAAGGFDRAEAHLTRRSLRLDERGWSDLAQATRTWLREAERIEEAAARRLDRAAGEAGGAAAAVDAVVAVTLYECGPERQAQATDEAAAGDQVAAVDEAAAGGAGRGGARRPTTAR